MDKNYTPLFDAIKVALEREKTINIAIDGPCAAGKTSLAKELACAFDTRIIAMDDFFLPKELRTKKRYARPGGNVHYERFLTEIAPHLTRSTQGPISYKRFDCNKMDYTQPIVLPFKPLTIVEGSYSMHKTLRDLYDIKVLLTIDPTQQESRLLQREGKERFAEFQAKWIPLEMIYFEDAKLKEICDFIF